MKTKLDSKLNHQLPESKEYSKSDEIHDDHFEVPSEHNHQDTIQKIPERKFIEIHEIENSKSKFVINHESQDNSETNHETDKLTQIKEPISTNTEVIFYVNILLAFHLKNILFKNFRKKLLM